MQQLSDISKEPAQILVVDDDNFIRTALEITLQSEGYKVITAGDGSSAIELIQQNSFAVIICDQRMPGISGIEVLKKSHAIQPDAVRIILTGNSDLDTVLQAINIGQVSQFIIKPWDDSLFRQAIATSVEKYRLIKENQNLHNFILEQHKALEKAHESLRRDLRIGGRIHETLLLGQLPGLIPGLAIDVLTIPSQEIDGDFFEFYQHSREIMDVVIGDVMGKGLPAALVGTAVKAQMMRFAIPFIHVHTYSKHQFWEEGLLEPDEILTHVHPEIISQLIELEYFVSLFYIRFNLSKHSATYVDCGSTKPIQYKALEKKTVFLKGENLPLGTLDKNEYQSFQTSFAEGDIFIFYSDGVTETKSPDQELYGVERLVEITQKNPQTDEKTLLSLIKSSVLSFAQRNFFDDDLTIIVIKILKLAAPAISQLAVAKFRADVTELNRVREYIAQLCSKSLGDVEAITGQLQLAINEIFCNIIKHGCHGMKDVNILIHGELTEEGVSIEISDQGRVFDPASIPDPFLNRDQDNGFGWYIIKEIVDQADYIQKESEKGWNHLRIFKRYMREGTQMQLDHTTQGNVLIITPEGESLDAKDAPEFKQKIITLLSTNEPKQVVFDLHRLNFIDSSGLGTLLSVLRVLNSKGGELKLACMNKPIRTMFELVSMHKIFEIFNTTDDAVRSFK